MFIFAPLEFLSHAQKDVSLCSSRSEIIIKFTNKTHDCINYQTKYYNIFIEKKGAHYFCHVPEIHFYVKFTTSPASVY